MTTYRNLLEEAVRIDFDPALRDRGFAKRRGMRWRRDELEVRVVFDSKSGDPYRAGAFTLEFERSTDGRFEVKLAGRVRIEQLLDAAQRQQFLVQRNMVAARLKRPPADFLNRMSASLREEYLHPFIPQVKLEAAPWMRFRDVVDASEWCSRC